VQQVQGRAALEQPGTACGRVTVAAWVPGFLITIPAAIGSSCRARPRATSAER
jgi:hypothetical protein